MEQWHNVCVALECVEERRPAGMCVCVSSFHPSVWTFDELLLNPPYRYCNTLHTALKLFKYWYCWGELFASSSQISFNISAYREVSKFQFEHNSTVQHVWLLICSSTSVFLDIDECSSSSCHVNARCINALGSFQCQCQPGFFGDGFYCSQQDG